MQCRQCNLQNSFEENHSFTTISLIYKIYNFLFTIFLQFTITQTFFKELQSINFSILQLQDNENFDVRCA